MNKRDEAAYLLVGALSALYDDDKIPEASRAWIKELLKQAMPRWKPVEDE